MTNSTTRVGRSGNGFARNGRVLRSAMLGSTALVAVTLASPATAQTAVGGGTITASGATVTSNTAGGGGVRVTGVTQGNNVTVNNVTINQTVNGPAAAALSIEGSSGTTGVSLTGTNNLTTTVSGNAALRITTTGNNFPSALSSGNVFTGSIGIDLSGPSFVDFTSAGQSQTINANGTALTGINAVSANATNINIGSSTISGFATGVNSVATNANFAGLVSEGGSISATNTGVNVSAPNGASVDSRSAITAPTGINANGGAGNVTVTTSGAGTINAVTAGTGIGIVTNNSAGTTTITQGAAIGGTTRFATGIDAAATGTGTVGITTAAAIAANTGIRATSATATGNTISIGGNITANGASGVGVDVRTAGFGVTIAAVNPRITVSGATGVSFQNGGTLTLAGPANYGTISSSGTAIDMLGGATGTTNVITNNGLIYGRVHVNSAVNTTIAMASTIFGNIEVEGTGTRTASILGSATSNYTDLAGSGVDNLTIGSNATFLGNVSLGGGNDAVIYSSRNLVSAANVNNATGDYNNLFDGGTGSDSFTVTLDTPTRAISIELGNLTNFESYGLTQGILTLTGSRTGSGPSWRVENGATLNFATSDYNVAGGSYAVMTYGGSVNVLSGAKVSGGNNFAATFNAANPVVFSNAGTINVDGNAFLSNGSKMDVTNSGTITSASYGGVRFESGIGSVTNTGTITGGSFTTGDLGSAVYAVSAITINNNGSGVLQTSTGGPYAVRLGSGSTVNNASGATIQQVAASQRAAINATGLATVNNQGTITTAATGAFGAIDAAGLTLTNSGKVVGVSNAINGTGAGAVSVTNTGTIGTGSVTGGAYTAGGTGDAIELSTSGVTNIDNSGTISGAVAGIAQTAGTTGGLTVVNRSGTITGTSNDGITARGVFNAVNAKGATISSTANSGIAVVGTSSVTNGGTLTGGNSAAYGYGFQSASTGAVTFNNFGSATGSQGGVVGYSSGAITINLFAGSTTGNIVGGSGNDTLALYTASGTGNTGTSYVVATNTLATGTPADATRVLVQNAGALAAPTVGTVNLAGGTDTLQLRGLGDGSGANGAAGSFSIGTSTGAEVLTKADTGTWTLTGAAITPGITINAGTGGTPGSGGLLIFNGTTGLTGPIYVNGGTIRAATAGAFGTGTIYAVDPTIQFATGETNANNYVLTVAAPASGDPTTFESIGANAITLNGSITTGTGNNANNAAIAANQYVTFAGTAGSSFTLGNTTATPNNWTGDTTINSGITLIGTAATISGGAIVDNGALIYNQGTAGTVAKVISGTGTLTKQGAGVLTLIAANTYTGATSVTGGILQLGDGTTNSSIASAMVALSNGTALRFNEATATTYGGSVSGAGTVQVIGAGPATLTGAITTTGGVTVDAGATVTLSSVTGAATNAVTVVGTGATVNVATGGTVTAPNSGINTNGGTSTTITNRGTITATGSGNNNDGVTANGTITLSNYGTIRSTGDNAGIVAFANGNSITNYQNATISGGTSANGNAVNFQGSGNTLTNFGTLTSASTASVRLGVGGSVSNEVGGVISGVVAVNSGGVLMLTNRGTVTGTSTTQGAVQTTGAASVITNYNLIEGGTQALVLNQGGTVYNYGTGSILRTTTTAATGDASGIYSNGALTLTNEGAISTVNTGAAYGVQVLGAATIGNTGTISAASAAGLFFNGAGSAVTNAGTITGGNSAATSYGIQAVTGAAGSITNQAAGRISGGVAGIARASGGALTIANSGVIVGTGTTSYGVNVSAGSGTITNDAGGIIVGQTNGVVSSVAAAINNAGTIASGTYNTANTPAITLTNGIAVQIAGGTVTNSGAILAGVTSGIGLSSTGVLTLTNTRDIAGYQGVVSSSTAAGNSLTNSGRIITGTIAGNAPGGIASGSATGNDAVRFAAGTITNQANGLILGQSDGVYGNGTGVVNVDNYGLISANNYAAIELNVAGTVHNYAGTITGGNRNTSATDTGTALRLNAGGTVINDAGASITAVAATNNVAVYSTGTTSLTNAGAISGAAFGVYVNTTNGTSTITNNGTIAAQTNDGMGTEFSAIRTGNAATITNNGTLTGIDGILTTGAGTIDNYGAITALSTGNGIGLLGGGTATNRAGGTITAIQAINAWGMYTASVAGTLVNEGRIDAGVGLIATIAGTTITNSGTIAAQDAGILGRNVALAATNSGTLTATATGALASVTGVRATLGGSFTNTGTINGIANGVVNSGAAISITNNGTITATTSAITSTGAFADTVTLGAASTTNGGIALGDGADTLNFTIGAAANGTINGGAGTDTFAVTGTGTGTLAGNITGFEALTKGGTGTLTLSGTNTGFQTVAINSGTLNVTGGNAINDTAAVTIASGAVLGVQTSETIGSLAGAGNISLGANTLTFGDATSTTFSGVASGTGGLTKVGSGVFTISGANTYTGATDIQAGTLRLGASNVLSDSTALTIRAGATLDLNTFSDTVGSFALYGTLTGGGVLTANTANLYGGTLGMAINSPTVNQVSGTTVLSGAVAGNVITATDLVILGGTLQLGRTEQIADTTRLTVNAAGTFDLQGFNETVASLVSAGTINGTGTLTAASYQLQGGTVNANLGAGTLSQTGGTTTLNGTSAATTVQVQNGTLVLGAAERLADIAALTISPGGTLNLQGFNETVGTAQIRGTLNGTGTLTAATYTLDSGTFASNPVVNANLGAGTLIVQGKGVSTLNGTAAAETVAIQSGTLRLGGNDRLDPAAALTVSNGATLDIAGFFQTVSGTVTNAGTITGDAGPGAPVLIQIAGSITNTDTGRIVGPVGIRSTGTGTVNVTNSGMIGTSTGQSGIEVVAGGAITNQGSGSIGGGNYGVRLLGGTTTVTNTGAATISGGQAALFVDTNAAGNVRNTAAITGGVNNILAYGTLNLSNAGTVSGAASDGIFTLGTAAILNTGSITAPTNSAIAGSLGLTVVNANGATLTGGSDANYGYAVQFAANGGTFDNYGSATGGAGGVLANDNLNQGGTGVAVNLFAGSTTGAILLGSGNDTLSLYGSTTTTVDDTRIDPVSGLSVTVRVAGSYAGAQVGAIDLGGGSNTLNLRGTGTGAFNGGATGVTTLNKLDSGSWTATNVTATTVNAGTVSGTGGSLTLAGAGNIGNIYVNGSELTLASTTAAGGALIHMIDPTTNFAATGTYTNNFDLAVPVGQQAANPNIFNNTSGGAIELAGSLTESVAGQYVTFRGGTSITLGNVANQWTGVTTIDANTNVIGTTATVSGGSITDNGTLTYRQTAAGSAGQAIGGSGVVVIDGGSLGTALTGAITTQRGVQVGAGTTAILTNASGATGNEVTFTGTGATLNVVSGGNVSTQNGNAVFSTQATNTVNNAGTLAGNATYTGVFLNATTGTNTVTNTGTIRGFNAISSSSTLNLTNSGTLTGLTGSSVFAGGPGTVIVNNGTITGISTGTALNSAVSLNASSTVTNNANATISGNRGIAAGGTTGPSTVDNYGRITGVIDNAVSLFAGGTATNYAGGTLSATATGGWGIYLTGGTSTIGDNRGTINADSGIVTNRDGSIALNSGTITATDAAFMTIGGTLAVTNSGSASGATGVRFVAGGSVANSGSLTGSAYGVDSAGAALTVTNTGTIAGGTLAIRSVGAFADSVTLGAASTTNGGISLDDGADTLTFTTGATATGTLDGGAAIDTFVVTGTGTSTLPGNIINFEILTKDGTGTLTLGGINAGFTTVNVNAGALNVTGGAAIDDTAAVTVAAAGTLGVLANETVGTLALAGTLNGPGTLTAATYTLNGATVNGNLGVGTLTNTGGVSTLNGTAAAATVNVIGGTLALGASDRLADAAAVTVASGAILDVRSFTDTVGALALNGTLNGTGTLTAATYTLNAALVNGNLGTGTLTQVGGISTLNGTAAATTVNVNSGTLTLGAANRLADAAAVTAATGAILDLATFSDTVGSLALNGTLNGTGTLTAATYTLNTAQVNGNLGTGTLTQAGGVSTLNGTAAATTVNVTAGTLALGAANRLGDAAAVTVASGTVLDLGTFSDTVGSLALNGTLNGSGTLTAATYALNGATVNGNLGTGALTSLGATALNGTSGAGTVNVAGGTLTLGAANRLADAAAVTVATGATLNLATFSDTVGTLALNGTLNGTGTLTATSYTLNAAAVNANLGAGTLIQAGGTSTLAGTASAATVNVNGGLLQLTANERLADASAVTVATGATLNVNGFTETVANVNGAGTVALGAGRLVLAGAGASSLGALTGTGNLDKTGTGTLALANAYASTGQISLLAGTTSFTGTSAGSLRVAGGTLTGTGTAAGGLTFTSGTVAPGIAGATNGSQFGTLTVGGLTASGGSYAVDFGGAATGFAADLIRVNGAAALSGTVAVAPTSFAGNERFQQLYTIVQANALTGTFANGGTFSAVTNDPSLFYRLRYDLVANAVVLQVQRQIDFAAAIPNGTGNQSAVAGALNGAAGLASDSFAASLNAIAASGNRGAVYDNLSGEAIADVTSSALFASDKFVELVRSRIGLGQGGAAAAGGYALRAGMSGDQRHGSGLAGTMQDGVNAGGGTAGSESGTGLWLQGYGAGQKLEGNRGQATTNSFASGLFGGLDGHFGGFTAGIAGGFTDVDTQVYARNSRIEGTLVQGGGYVGYDAGVVYGAVTGSYYDGDVTVGRQLPVGLGQASGKTNVHGYTVGGLFGTRFDVGGGTLAGFEITGQQTQAVRRAYTETAPGGLGLITPRDSRDVFTGTAQLKLSHQFTGNGWTASPYASGGVRYNSGDLTTINAMRFSGAPTGTGGFLVQGAKLEKTMGVFTGGIEIRPSDKFRIDVSAGGAIGDRTHEGQVRVSARIGF